MSGIKNRGFGSMTPEKRREIARKGGQVAQSRGTAHKFDRNEAQSAGRKGGQTVSANRDYMAEIGRRGGQNSGKNRQKKMDEQVLDVPVEDTCC